MGNGVEEAGDVGKEGDKVKEGNVVEPAGEEDDEQSFGSVWEVTGRRSSLRVARQFGDGDSDGGQVRKGRGAGKVAVGKGKK